MQPLFSIITVTYNAGENLKHTIKSVNSQSFTDYEHLIIDGCSTDSTLLIADKFKIDKTIIFSEKDNGIYDAMNKGISLSKGKYLIFLNAGDTFHSESILKMYADAIYKNDYPGVVYGQTMIVNSSREIIGDRHIKAPENLTYQSFANGMMVCHQAFVALKSITGFYNLKHRYSSDYEWCIRCLQHSKNNVYIPYPTIDYLKEGVTTNNRVKSLIERFKIMCYYYGTLPSIFKHILFVPRFIKNKIKGI